MSACSSAGVMVAPCWIIWSISALASAALEARNCCAGALEWHEPQRASMIAVGFEPGDGPEDESAVDDVAAGPEPFCWSASDCWNPARSCCFSAALSFALGCSSVNCSGGMPPSRACCNSWALRPPFHSEKLTRTRPALMSCCASHENGAILRAHHDLVLLLWQS